ncbi:MAG TPA: phosphoglycerate kinase, partial [Arenibacter sp.]|nr:phosphoglycerate kinase [Arenibacter sp.]
LSLKHICSKVSEVLGVKVKFSTDSIGPVAEKAVAELKSGEVLLLENLRFHSEEEKGDKNFAEQLSKLG